MHRQEPPDDCPYRILHALEKKEGGIQAFPRRCGKTTMLVEMANKIAKAGYPTYFVSMNHAVGERTKRQYGLDKTVVLATENQAAFRFRGMAPGYVLFDEILPDTVKRIMRMMVRSVLVAAYFTPR